MLGKSIYIYVIAVFAQHFGIPVQYIGNTGDLLMKKLTVTRLLVATLETGERCSLKSLSTICLLVNMRLC